MVGGQDRMGLLEQIEALITIPFQPNPISGENNSTPDMNSSFRSKLPSQVASSVACFFCNELQDSDFGFFRSKKLQLP